MDKKDIYEHLAKIYLEPGTPAAKKNPGKSTPKRKSYFLLAAIPAAVGVCAVLLSVAFRSHPVLPLAQTSMVISPETIKIGFNLDSAKKQVYDLELRNLNLSGYKAIVFSLRDSNYNDTLSFRIEFMNAFKERSELYVKDVSNKWKEYRFELADFKGITDWSEMTGLSFVVEEWNTRDNKGILFIDNVRFLK